MKRALLIFFCPLAGLLFTACNHSPATISGCIKNGAAAKITLLHRRTTSAYLLDTLRADANGCFRYKVKKTGKRFDPMFISLSIDSSASAMLLVKEGEDIQITAEKGRHTCLVTGSDDSRLLQEAHEELYKSSAKFDSLMRLVQAAQAGTGNNPVSDEWNRELSEIYLNQHRAAVRFLIDHPVSLTCFFVLNEKMPNELPVFSRNEDAVFFKTVYDSLKTRYPTSEYLLALREEYEARFNQMTLQYKLENSAASGFVDLHLPDQTAKIESLSSLKGQVILVYFWHAANREQLLYNNELKTLYARYHPKGLAIYQVSLDTDKAVWAKTVSDQALPWINVCDGFGASSPAMSAYNVMTLPAAFLINRSGDIVAANLSNQEIEQKIRELCR